MAESVGYRSVVVASQYVSWLLGQFLRVRYSVRARPYLERMTPSRPQTIKERLLRRALIYALASVGAI